MFLLKRGLHYYFSKAQEMSEKYEEIGAYLLAVPVMLFVVLFLLDIAGCFMIPNWCRFGWEPRRFL